MEAIVLAGGRGTRLRSVVSDVPKPMAPINGKPFLSGLLTWLKLQGVSKTILSVGYKHDCIKSFFGDSYAGMDIAYSVETSPLGTGGGVVNALDACSNQDVILINGDTFFNVDIVDLYSKHCYLSADMTLALKPMQCFSRYGAVKLDDKGRVTAFLEKAYRKEGLVNGGVYVLKKELLRFECGCFSLEQYMADHLEKRLFGSVVDQYFIDIGIPEDFERAQKELKFE